MKTRDGKSYKAFNKIKKLLVWVKTTKLAITKPRSRYSLDVQGMASADDLDRISSLPIEVICEILKHLTIREAISTSSLSTTWRYKWMSIPKLSFTKNCALNGQTNAQLIKFLDNVLSPHDGGLTKFELNCYLCVTSLEVSRWLMILSRKRLNILVLRLKWSTSDMLPPSLFLCQDLKELVLWDCALRLPPRSEFKGFKNLIFLCLRNVNADKETIEFLVSNSPFLKKFSVNGRGSTIYHLNINAPNLERCDISAWYGDITFINMPKLKSASVRTMLPSTVANCRLDRDLRGFRETRFLRIYYPLIEFLSINNFWERTAITCQHLHKVFLDLNFQDPKQRLAAIYLFRCAPSLKTLVIIVPQDPNGVSDNDTSFDGFYETLHQSQNGAIFPSLVLFYLDGFQGSKNEMDFIQFLLLDAKKLWRMDLYWKKNVPSRLAKEQALAKLQKFQRSSSLCEIIIPDLNFGVLKMH